MCVCACVCACVRACVMSRGLGDVAVCTWYEQYLPVYKLKTSEYACFPSSPFPPVHEMMTRYFSHMERIPSLQANTVHFLF